MTGDLVRVRVQLPWGDDSQFAQRGPGWSTLMIREGTSDEDVLTEMFISDVYRLRGLDLAARSEPDRPNVKRPVTVIDVGANIGALTVLAHQFGAGRVIAVEPEPANLDLLHRNVDHLVGVKVVPMAVGPSDGHTFLVGDTGTGHTSDIAGSGVHVEQIGLGSLIAGVDDPIGLLKMDVEGGEFLAIAGCPSDLLARCERIHLEFHGPATAAHLKADTIDQLYGALMTKLAYTHAVSVFGNPQAGGMLFAHRYGI